MLILTNLFGLATIVYVLYKYSKNKLAFLLLLALALIVANLSLVTALPDEYLARNNSYLLFSGVKADLVYLYTVLAYLLDFLWLFLFVACIKKLERVATPKRYMLFLIVSLVIVLGTFSFAFYRVVGLEKVDLLIFSDKASTLLIALISAFTLGLLMFYGFDQDSHGLSRIVRRSLSIPFIGWIIFVGLATLNLFGDFYPQMNSGRILAFASINLIPWLYLRRWISVFRKYDKGEQNTPTLEKLLIQYQISKREREIIGIIREGKSNKQIANELSISEATVKDHIHNIYSKTLVKNRVQLLNLFKD